MALPLKSVLVFVLALVVLAPGSAQAANTIEQAIVAIESGDDHTLALTKGGRVLAWGRNFRGQLGDGTTVDRSAPVFVQGLPRDSAIVQVAAGEYFSLALTADGRVFAWGSNSAGELGDGTNMHRSLPRQVTIPGSPAIASIAAEGSAFAVVAGTGALWAWGRGAAGQLGNGRSLWTGGPQEYATPQQARVQDPTTLAWSPMTGVAEVATGYEHTIVRMTNGELWSFGDISQGQLGLNAGSVTSTPRHVPAKIDLASYMPGCVPTRIRAGSNASYAVCADGKAYSWGDGGYGQLGISSGWNGSSLFPRPMNTGGRAIVDIVTNGDTTLARATTGVVLGMGHNGLNQLGVGGTNPSTNALPIVLTALQDATLLALGTDHGLAVKADGDVRGWGITDHGELGDGQARNRGEQVEIPGLTGIARVAAGDDYSIAIGANGSVWAWGDNEHSTLGDGTTTDRTTPLQVTAGSLTAVPIASVSAGRRHVLALSAGGDVYAWGDNATGQLGDGSTTDRAVPTLIDVPGAPVVRVAAGTSHSIAVTSAGAVYAWGHNERGQVGTGVLGGTVSTPRLVATLPERATDVGAGETSSVALLASGAVYAWGGNSSRELGAGITTSTPVATPTRSNPGMAWPGAQLAVGDTHVMLRTVAGDIWGWGSNDEDQLHVINRTSLETPQHVYPTLGLTGIVDLATGAEHLLARTADGSIIGWGQSAEYQFGHGTYGDYTSIEPTRLDLAPGDPVTAMDGGATHTLVVRGGKVFGWGFTGDGALAIAQTRFTTAPVLGISAPTVAQDPTTAPSGNGNRPSGGELGANPAPGTTATLTVEIYGSGTLRVSQGQSFLGVCRSGPTVVNGVRGETCTLTGVPVGASLTLAATPAPGYAAVGITALGQDCPAGPSCTFTFTGAGVVAGRFTDTTAPETYIFHRPELVTTSTSASIVVSSNEEAVTFRCWLNDVQSSCTSNVAYPNRAPGVYHFRVASIDRAGNIDPTPATYSWTIDANAPTLSALAGPTRGALLLVPTAAFTYTATNATVTCELDGAAHPCTGTSLDLAGLADGAHAVRVTATNAAGTKVTRETEFIVRPAGWSPIITDDPIVLDPPPGPGPVTGPGPETPPASPPTVVPSARDTAAPTLTVSKQACPRKLRGARCTAFLRTAAAWRSIAGTVADAGGVASVQVVAYQKSGRTFRVVSGTRLATKPTLKAAQATINAATVTGSAWKRALPKLPKGTWTVRIRALDRAGNASGWTTRTVRIT